MKKIKLIALIALTTIAFVSCKKEATETETAVDTAKTEITAANLETATFKIEGMTCEMGCAKTIENKLAGLEGVGEATVDFESKTATVKFDKEKQNPETIVATVEAVAGGDTYTVEDVQVSHDKAMLDQEKKKSCCSKDAKDKKTCSSEEKKDKKCCSSDKKSTTKKEEGTL